MFPFQVDPAWYEEFWMTDHAKRRRSLSGNLARVAVVIALLAGGSVALGHVHTDQWSGYQDWEHE